MNDHSVDFQNLGLLLLVCFAVALIVCGILLLRTRFLDSRSEKASGQPSRIVGRLLIVIGAILAFMGLFLLLLCAIGVM